MKNNNKNYGEHTELNLKVLITLSRSTQAVRKKEIRTIKEGGLTVAQFAVLEALYHKGDMRICEIIEKVLSTGGNMTVVIENLLKDGLVSKCPDENDRRVSLIHLTEKGNALIEKIFPKHLENINEIFDVLTTEDKINLINLFKKLSGVEK